MQKIFRAIVKKVKDWQPTPSDFHKLSLAIAIGQLIIKTILSIILNS